jgi:hypothetical protein
LAIEGETSEVTGTSAGVLVACPLVMGIGRSRWGRRAAALAGLLTSALAPRAEAQSSAAERLWLTWSATEGCPSQEELLGEVGKLLGDRANREASKEPIPVKATVSREAGGSFVVRLETPGEGGTQARELRGATCKAVADAAALILALMIDPDAAMTPEEEAPTATKRTDEDQRGRSEKSPTNTEPTSSPRLESAPPSKSPRPPSAAPTTTTTTTTTAKTKDPTRAAPTEADPTQPIELRLGAWAGADIGSLPGLAPGFGALGSIAFGAPRLAIGIAFWPDNAGTLAALPSAGSDVGLLAGEIGLCSALLQKPLEIAPCAAVEIGQLFAEGFGVSDPRRGASVWVALKGGGALLWRPFQKQKQQQQQTPNPLDRLGITARIELVIPLVRPRFVIEGIGPVHSPAALAGRGSLGLEISL